MLTDVPEPAAPSSASHSACSSTSPSECATTPRSHATGTPPSMTLLPGPKAWTSNPFPPAVHGHGSPRGDSPAQHELGRARSPAGDLQIRRDCRAPAWAGRPSHSTACDSSVGMRPALLAAASAERRIAEAKHLWGQRAPQCRAVPRYGLSGGSLRLIVSATGTASSAPHLLGGNRIEQRIDLRGRYAGTRRVVHQHPIGILGRQPLQRQPYGVTTFLATADCAHARVARQRQVLEPAILGGNGHDNGAAPLVGQKRRQGPFNEIATCQGYDIAWAGRRRSAGHRRRQARPASSGSLH